MTMAIKARQTTYVKSSYLAEYTATHFQIRGSSKHTTKRIVHWLMLRVSLPLLLLFLSGDAFAATPANAIDDLVTRYARLGRFSGAVLVARDGKVVHAAGYGLANREHGVPNRA